MWIAFILYNTEFIAKLLTIILFSHKKKVPWDLMVPKRYATHESSGLNHF